MYEHVTNTKVQEDIAFPAMLKIETGTTPGDTAVFIDTAASNHMVTAESRLSTHHVVNQIYCSVRIKGSCGLSSATSKGTVLLRIRNDRDELVPINLEVLVVLNLGASIFSVGALHEKGANLDLLSVPPVLRHDNHAFPISTEVPRVYVFHIVPDTQEMQKNIFDTTVDSDIWHRKMGHCHPRALKQLAEKPTTGVKFSHNVEAGEREVCAVSKSKKSAHPPSYRPRSNTRLWGKRPVVLYGDCQPIAMFADDMSRMRWVVLIRTKDEAADALKQVVQDVADPEGICVGKIRCDGGGQFKGRFQNAGSHLESRSRPTHRTSRKEILSQSVVLAPSSVLRAAYFWELPTFLRNCGVKRSQLRCTSGIARRRMSWEARLLSRYGRVNHSVA